MSRIVRIPILPLRIVNAHLLVGSKGCVLIDAGLPGSAPKIEKVLRSQGLSFKDIRAIVITHAHVDHAGGAAELREKSRAPIIAHEEDLPYYRREKPMTFCPTGRVGRLFFKTPLPHQAYTAFEPDVLLSNGHSFDLSHFGVTGTVKHTPGHTKGSISVKLGNNEALVGDLVASGILIGGVIRTSHAIRPSFEDDPQAVATELLRFLDAGVERFYMGHGGPLDAREVRRHAESLASGAMTKVNQRAWLNIRPSSNAKRRSGKPSSNANRRSTKPSKPAATTAQGENGHLRAHSGEYPDYAQRLAVARLPPLAHPTRPVQLP